jgi:hypothetical protein
MSDIQLARVRKSNRMLRSSVKLLGTINANQQRTIDDLNRRIATLNQQLADKTDAALPQKAEVLKQLAYLTNATARAVRTAMWSVKRPGDGSFR